MGTLRQICIFALVAAIGCEAAKISLGKGKKPAKIDDLCARMHNNTALEGADPIEMLQATAFECQKKCVDMFPACSAVVYYYLHNETNHHYCYLFEKNSIDEKMVLVEQKPDHKKDLVRMLEIVEDCHAFDAHPPLEDDGLASSTDKVDRKKRQHGDEAVLGVGDWTDWSDCTLTGHEVRSQACAYGRKIQRRGCPARQAPQRYPNYPPQPDPRQQQQQQEYQRRFQEQERQRQAQLQQQQQQPTLQLSPQQPQAHPRAPPPQYPPQAPQTPERSPYDQAAQEYQQRMAHLRSNQRHAAVAQASGCAGGACPDPRLQQRPQPVPPTYVPAPPPPSPTRYRPAPPPPPACNGPNCALRQVAGVWHDWSDWSDCSCTCDDGIKQRRRECSTNNCQGPEYEQATCNLGPCQTWSEWCEWSSCSSSCGAGERSRTRFCHLGTNRCEGKDYETDRCDAGPCPEWSSWEDWSQCSASCGPGIQGRQRTCLGGLGDHLCPGPKTDQRSCENQPCSTWANWQEWGACSASCGDGMKRRQRVCQFGTDCQGPMEETMFCYGPPCAAWTDWCEWSGCSSKCGPGQRTRTRACLASDGTESRECQGLSIENTLCEGTNCCRWSDWCHWSMCDKECGGGQSIRTRTCVNDRGQSDPSCHCDGNDREERQCNTQSCTPQCQWTSWCEWSICSTLKDCEVGIQSRSRQCVGEAGCHCMGPADETQQCRGPNPCEKTPPC